MRRHESCARQVRSLELALESFACRDELVYRREGVQRFGKVKYRLGWGRYRSILLVLDFDAGELCFPQLLSRIDTRAAWFKRWSAGYRRAGVSGVVMIVRRGALALRITVREGAVAHCAFVILEKAKELVAEVTEAASRDGSLGEAAPFSIGDAQELARSFRPRSAVRAADSNSAASG